MQLIYKNRRLVGIKTLKSLEQLLCSTVESHFVA